MNAGDVIKELSKYPAEMGVGTFTAAIGGYEQVVNVMEVRAIKADDTEFGFKEGELFIKIN